MLLKIRYGTEIELETDSEVYGPLEDTELALELLKKSMSVIDARTGDEFFVADVGCGTGVLGIAAILLSSAAIKKLWASDIDRRAVELAARNISKNLKQAPQIAWSVFNARNLEYLGPDGPLIKPILVADHMDRLGFSKTSPDLVIFNPPYLPDEDFLEQNRKPTDAQWAGGPTGIETTLDFLNDVKQRCQTGTLILIVASSHSDLDGLARYFSSNNFYELYSTEKHLFFETLFAKLLIVGA